MSLQPARLAAARALLDAERGRHLDEALADHLAGPPEALGQAWHLALTALRRRGELRAMVRAVNPRRVDPKVRAALHVGLVDLHFSRTPPHAAIDQAVRLAKALGAGHAAGFVNAVLRRAVPVEGLPATVNHPDWLVERWVARYGAQATAAWCARADEPPPLSLVATGSVDALAEDLRRAGLEPRPACAAGRPVPGVLTVDGVGGRVSELPGYAEGRWFVMDPAAAAAADLVGARPGLKVLDACAAPGGKTLRMLGAGAEVLACDRSAPRLERLRSSLERLGLDAELAVVDWEAPGERPRGPFDVVLVDAPCTALGTTRRHPELRWSRVATDVQAMAIRQARVLSACADLVRRGGALVYSVCSPEPEEGPERVRALLAARPGWALEAELLTAPPAGDEDAHYAARVRRPEDP